MAEKFSEGQKSVIRAYYNCNRGVCKGNNARGEPMDQFDIFAQPPRVGARNTIERVISDLPDIMWAEIKMGLAEF